MFPFHQIQGIFDTDGGIDGDDLPGHMVASHTCSGVLSLGHAMDRYVPIRDNTHEAVTFAYGNRADIRVPHRPGYVDEACGRREGGRDEEEMGTEGGRRRRKEEKKRGAMAVQARVSSTGP